MWKYIRCVLTQGWYLIYCYFAWILKYSRHPEKYPLEIRYQKIRKLLQKVARALHVEINDDGVAEVVNEEAGKVSKFFVGNHISLFDPVALICISEKPITFVGKKEVKKMPIVGRILTILGGVFLDRENLKEELKTFLEVARRMKENPSLTWFVYAEGTRNKGDLSKVAEFKHGTFKFPMKVNAKIVTISTAGTAKILSAKTHYKKYFVDLKLDKVLNPEEYSDYSSTEVAKLCEVYCQEGLNEIYNSNEEKYNNLKKKA